MNNHGTVVFSARLTESGSPVGWNSHGIWAKNPDGQLQMVTRIGEQIEVAPGDLRRVAGLDLLFGGGADDGQPLVFNDAGQILFWAYFEDGSTGIFVSTVPEPAGAVLGTAACATLLLRRRGAGVRA